MPSACCPLRLPVTPVRSMAFGVASRSKRTVYSSVVSVHELKGALGYCARFADEEMAPRPIRWPPAAHRTGPEVRSSVTPFSASAGQQFGANDPDETQREFR